MSFKPGDLVRITKVLSREELGIRDDDPDITGLEGFVEERHVNQILEIEMNMLHFPGTVPWDVDWGVWEADMSHCIMVRSDQMELFYTT
jgi:hypothetical protein